MSSLDGKRILITGGTGSLGKVLTARILSGDFGSPQRVVIFSRDEAKQHSMRMSYLNRSTATDEIIFENFERTLEFIIGDVRDIHAISAACRDIDVVFNAAALKQVPSCEYFPVEAVRTNIDGPANIVRAISEQRLGVDVVVGISTDKACQPVNVMGMTKAVQERIFISANVRSEGTRFVCARYGNVLASRGSVIPLFKDQIAAGGPVTITDVRMTRFLLSLNDAVDVIVAAATSGQRGETFIPRVPAAKVTDIADALIGGRRVETRVTGIRPGEKLHEMLISEEEVERTIDRSGYYVIRPMLPELQAEDAGTRSLDGAFTSGRHVMSAEETVRLLDQNGLLADGDNQADLDNELLR